MRITRSGGSFAIVGENIHATRSLSRKGRHIAIGPDGRESIRFETAAGERYLAIPGAITAGTGFAAGKVRHVAAAVVALMTGSGKDADDAQAYIEILATRQAAAGADWIDLNVDEVAQDTATQRAAMRLLVRIVEGLCFAPPALDSSSSSVIKAGLEASAEPGRLMLNSASVERPEVLDMAAAHRCAVVVGAAGKSGLPSGVDDRVANAGEIVAAAASRGIALEAMHVDPLVLPVGVDPEAGARFLEAIRRIRAALGHSVHIGGGLSNVSFGLPGRRLLNDVFIDLVAEAGADSGIVDPISSDPTRAFGRDRSSRSWQLAANLLTGADPYGMEYIAAFRAGELEGEA